jgi:alkylation response protein AidB-like acyl-CoA dehydrogenase
MDFELSEDQRALGQAARDLLDDAAAVDRVRAALGAPAGYDETLWKQIGEQGWLAIGVPEDAGGLGLGFVEVAVLAEEIGRHVAPAPFVSTALAISALTAGGEAGGTAAGEWLERLVAGNAVGCVAWGGGLVIDAPAADIAICVDDDRVRGVPLPERPSAEPAMDQTRSVGWLDAPPDSGFELGGVELARLLLDRGAAAYSATLLGSSQRMLEVSVEYAQVREQFGRPIGSFQALKHRLADMLVDVEGMRSAAYYAAWAVGADAADRGLAASTAKAWCSAASDRVMSSALQVHGGIGFTWEHDLHLFLKRAHVDRTAFGTAAFHRERIARLLRERIEAGEDLW